MSMSMSNAWLRRTLVAGFLALAATSLAGCGEFRERGDFQKLVENKNDDEVRKSVGKPTAIDSSDPQRVTWVYEAATFDISNKNKRDGKTMVVFKPDAGSGKLRVSEVRFE